MAKVAHALNSFCQRIDRRELEQMAGSFFDSFNPALEDMETQFTETWIHNSVEYPAIVIDMMDQDEYRIKGGALLDATVRITIRDEIFEQSGVKMGDFVSARGSDMSVGKISTDGDASKTLICIAKGLDIWK